MHTEVKNRKQKYKKARQLLNSRPKIEKNVAHFLNIDIETMPYSQTKRWISIINIETQKEIYRYKERRRNEYLEQRQQ